MTADHLEELKLVMNDFEKSTLMNFQGMDGAKFVVEEFSNRKIINGVFYLQDLPTALKVAKDGDKICLKSGNYVLNETTEIVKKSVQIHGNKFGPTGYNPDTSKGELAQILFDLSGGDMPDIFWDGLLPLSQLVFGQPENEKMIITNNGDATMLAIKPIGYMLPFFEPAILDINEFDGEITPLEKVEFDEAF